MAVGSKPTLKIFANESAVESRVCEVAEGMECLSQNGIMFVDSLDTPAGIRLLVYIQNRFRKNPGSTTIHRLRRIEATAATTR